MNTSALLFAHSKLYLLIMSKQYRINEFAKRIGKAPSTVRRWEREGKFTSRRGAGGQRYYDESDVQRALRIAPEDAQKKVIVYCRVSSPAQKPDLRFQVDAMRTFCLGAGIAVDEWIEEIGGGMNFKRKQFIDLVERIERFEVKHLLIAHKDRLVRFGFEFFEYFCERHGCELTVVNQEQLSPQQEMVEDLMAIIHCFSSRLYGLRSYKKQIEKAATGEGN